MADGNGMDLNDLHRALGTDGLREWMDANARILPPDEPASFDGAVPVWDGRHPSLEQARPRRLSRRAATTWEGNAIPDRPWLVRGLIPGRNVTLLSGDGGTGKSLLALQLAVSVAARRGWLGREVCDHGPVIYLSAEDELDELHRRCADIIRPLEIRFKDLPDLYPESLAGEDALLARENRDGTLSPTPLLDELHDFAGDVRPRLIVLDTLADLYPSSEIDRAKVRAFVQLLRRLALRHDCAVLLLGHPSLTGLSSGSGASGSTAWHNSVRSRLYLQREVIDGVEADPDVRILSNKKAQYARTGETIRLRWKEGTFVVEDTGAGAFGETPAAKAERVFMKLLDRFAGQGRRVNGNSGSNYAPKVFAEHPDAEGCTKRHLANAMNRLFDAGEIETREVRENSKPVRFIARPEPSSEGREDDQ